MLTRGREPPGECSRTTEAYPVSRDSLLDGYRMIHAAACHN